MESFQKIRNLFLFKKTYRKNVDYFTPNIKIYYTLLIVFVIAWVVGLLIAYKNNQLVMGGNMYFFIVLSLFYLIGFSRYYLGTCITIKDNLMLVWNNFSCDEYNIANVVDCKIKTTKDSKLLYLYNKNSSIIQINIEGYETKTIALILNRFKFEFNTIQTTCNESRRDDIIVIVLFLIIILLLWGLIGLLCFLTSYFSKAEIFGFFHRIGDYCSYIIDIIINGCIFIFEYLKEMFNK